MTFLSFIALLIVLSIFYPHLVGMFFLTVFGVMVGIVLLIVLADFIARELTGN